MAQPDEETVRGQAVRRLLRDWRELQQEPISTVSAAPEPDNIFSWHCNLRPRSGIYRGVVFHLELKFPPTYPALPPTLRLCTIIPHPNVFDHGYICLNMLRPPSAGSYSGWSSAYTAQSILLQLQSFLFAENIPQDGGYDRSQVTQLSLVVETKKRIAAFTCRCGHSAARPYPPLPSDEEDVSKGVSDESAFPAPLDGSRNTLNPVDIDEELTMDATQLLVSKRTRHGWHGVRAAKGFYLGPDQPEGAAIYFEGHVGRGMGVCRIGFALGEANRDLGTDALGWGFGGTGKKAHGNVFSDFGEGYQADDVVGAYCALRSGRIHFFKNGVHLGCAFAIEPEYLEGAHKIYPALCLRESSIRVNFGRSPWWKPPRFARLAQPVPKIAVPQPTRSKQAKEARAAPPPNVAVDHLTGLPSELLSLIASELQWRDLLSLRYVSRRLRDVVAVFSLLERRELVCFHSKVGWQEDVLGVGVSIIASGGRRGQLTSPLELLSEHAFTHDGVRRGVLLEPFEFFLPLVLNGSHGRRAYPLIQAALAKIDGALDRSWVLNLTPTPAKYGLVDRALTVLPKIMNQMVVSLLYDVHGAPRPFPKHYHVEAHLSDRALQGFCSFHHLFLFLRQQLPDLSRRATEAVDAFLHAPSKRLKSQTADLGEFLALLAVSDRAWPDVAEVFVKELFTRHVLWTLKAYPALAEAAPLPRGAVDEERLAKTLSANLTSLRVVMFQVFFLQHFCKPEGRGWEALLTRYNLAFGQPNAAMKKALAGAGAAILRVQSWPAFFDRIGMACPSKPFFSQLLHRALAESAGRGYHDPFLIKTPK